MQIEIPKGYSSQLNLFETQVAIKLVKDSFQKLLANSLNLHRVTAPLFVKPETGLNDNLNGVDRPVSFGIKEQGDAPAEIVHSLAKWKRYALKKYGFKTGVGLYTDMNAIRRDEYTDAIHSIYVDQWDWELIISPEERNLNFLKNIVTTIYNCLLETERVVLENYPQLGEPELPEHITFITSQDLEDMYPGLSSSEREYKAVKEYGAVFIIGIGDTLNSGNPHDNRAPDYDDWSLNGDILLYNKLLDITFELSSMGIRVNEESLSDQLGKSGNTERAELPFQASLLKGELPLTIGGGIGQSRLCMYFLRKAHIGEVQSSIWRCDTVEQCTKLGINLL